jgi:hypothetical protein
MYNNACVNAYFKLPEDFRAVYEGRPPTMIQHDGNQTISAYESEHGRITPLQAMRIVMGFGAAYGTYVKTQPMIHDETTHRVVSGLAGIIVAFIATRATRGMERKL